MWPNQKFPTDLATQEILNRNVHLLCSPITLTKIIIYLHSHQWYTTRLPGYQDTANELDNKLNPEIKF